MKGQFDDLHPKKVNLEKIIGRITSTARCTWGLNDKLVSSALQVFDGKVLEKYKTYNKCLRKKYKPFVLSVKGSDAVDYYAGLSSFIIDLDKAMNDTKTMNQNKKCVVIPKLEKQWRHLQMAGMSIYYQSFNIHSLI